VGRTCRTTAFDANVGRAGLESTLLSTQGTGNAKVGGSGDRRWEYGLWAVLIGVGGLVVAFAIVALAWSDQTGVAAIGAIAGPIAAIVSAYFGIQYSQKAAADAAETRKDAEKQVERAESDKEAAIESIRQGVLPALTEAAQTQEMSSTEAEGFAAKVWDDVRGGVRRT
jgi:hypothetical protein